MARARQPYDANSYKQSVIDRAKELSKVFSLGFNPSKIDNYGIKKRLPPRYLKFIKEVCDMLEKHYPGRGDIHFELTPTFKTVRNTYGSNHINEFEVLDSLTITTIYIVIWFPEVTVVNRKKHSVTIKNLFTRIPIKISHGSRGTMEFQRIQGTRTTLSLEEFKAMYSHSHLPSRDYSEPEHQANWENFCTGDGDINQSQALLNSELDMDIVNLMLLQVDPFVKWESLEGGPHRRMSSVNLRAFDYPFVSFSNRSYIYSEVENQLNRGKVLDIDWKFYNNQYQIVDNEKFENTLRDLLIRNYERYFIYKDEQGNYFVHNSLDRSVVEPSDKWIPFRGEKKFFRVEGEIKKAETNNIKYINPQIKSYVKSRLEFKINNAKIRNLVTQQ